MKDLWNHWKRTQTWVVARVLGAVVVMVFLALWFQHAHCPACEPPHCANDENNHQQGWVRWICSTINDPEAVFALALVFCNALFFGYLSRQVRQSESALTETKRSTIEMKRSVDVLVEIERGRVELSFIAFVPPSQTAPGETRHGFVNSGRTTAIVVERRFQILTLDPTRVPPDNPDLSAFVGADERMPLAPGETYGFGFPKHITGETLSANFSLMYPQVIAGTIRVYSQGFVRYQIVTGEVYRNWFTHLYIVASGSWVVDAGCAFNGHMKEPQASAQGN